MKSRKVFYYMVSLLLAALTAACTDDLDGGSATTGTAGNLQVTVPLLHSYNTRAGEDDGTRAANLTYNATEEECRINSLRLFAFPKNGKGELLNEYLGTPGTSFYEQGWFDGGVEVATYNLQISSGTYRIYVVANMEEVLKDKTVTSESVLKDLVMDYRPGGKPGMPVAGDIPMIYEPLEDTEISDKTTNVTANLKFTCVKVRLNLLFDPANAEMQTALKDNGLQIQNITARNLSPFTKMVWGGVFYDLGSHFGDAKDSQDQSYKKIYNDGISSSSPLYASGTNANMAGCYYSDWTNTPANADKSNADVIGALGTAMAAPADVKDKWLFQGTYYLPERYIEKNGQQSFLTLNGKIGGNANSYTIPLGHTDDGGKDPRRTFPRSTYYEIIGTLKSVGNITLDCQTMVKEWEPVSIDADFSHTTLWVDKTKAELTSLTTDSIYYQTNAAMVEFGCDKKISIDGESKDFIVAAKTYTDRITFTINPNIPYSAYAAEDLNGTAKVWIKANNLVKYLDVKYNIEPLFEVDPLEVTIFYDKDNTATNTKKITWTTNLGGIELEKTSSTIGSSTINIKLDDKGTGTKMSPLSEGTFSVTAGDPVTTIVHEFKAYSKDKNPLTDKKEERLVRVIVKPSVGPYRIYFRAINDMAYNGISGENKFQVNQFNGILDEYYGTGDNNNNWQDGWDGKNWNKDINSAKHNVYIYSQIGETYGTAIPAENVWFFNGYYDNIDNNKQMTGDPNNPGWYYKDMAMDAQGERLKGDHSKKTIKPGETFMIFYSFNNNGADLHRCPHHMAPGIPLFNYEDREGWILYDPTSDPYYRIFDEKPIVKDVTYTVYTKDEINGWMCQFGVATDNPASNSSTNPQFTFWDNRWGGNTAKSMEFSTENINGTQWYVTKIKLKAVDGYHEKSILVQADGSDTDITKTIFGGHSYERYGDVGYFDGASWHPGKPQ